MDTYILPAAALRGLVVFPGTSVSFDVSRKRTKRAIELATKGDSKLFLVTQRDINEEDPGENGVYTTGCIVRVVQYVKISSELSRAMVTVESRAKLEGFVKSTPFIKAEVTPLAEKEAINVTANNAYWRIIREMFDSYMTLIKKMPGMDSAINIGPDNIGRFADAVTSRLLCGYDIKQEILDTVDVYRRLDKVVGILKNEIDILSIKKRINDEVMRKIDSNQREYFLREELKVIEDELGNVDGTGDEFEQYRDKIKKCNFPEEAEEKLLTEVDRAKRVPSSSPESGVIRTYLDTVLSLPWNEVSEDCTDINRASEILEADHYGLEKVKERILEYLSVHSLTNGKDGTVLCLSGPPGTGKTSIASSVAGALGRKFVRISLGGVHDEAEIRGHRKTYIGSMPGRIIDAIKQAGTKNPVILLDEIDKIGSDYKGDPTAALLEILDFEQNATFRDNYVEIPFDLSQVVFIATANNVNNIPLPLLDRVELIEVSGYTNPEKFEIAKRHLIPKCIVKNGLKGKRITVADDAIEDIINYYTREAGVRGLERKISELMRKLAKVILSGEKKSAKITSKNLCDYLGRHKYDYDMMNEQDEVGTVRGLAWTSVGGDTLSVEVNVMEGTGKVELTGNLGDVMKESCMTAVSYVRSCSEELNIENTFYKTKDIHIHVPEGAVPKDGPSAGITIATAVASALSNKPVKCDVAMTGEITLRGNVLPIGGLKEKSLAAYRAGIRTVIIPDKNVNDIEDIPEDIRNNINFVSAKTMDTVFKNAFA